MSNRFNALKSSNTKNIFKQNNENKQNKNLDQTTTQSKSNIFINSSKDSRFSKDSSKNSSKDSSKNSRFSKNSHSGYFNKFRHVNQVNQKIEFNAQSEFFPQLNQDLSNNDIVINCSEQSYLEKIKVTKLNAEKREPIPPGWQYLISTNNNSLQKHKITKTTNIYYNPSLTVQILNDRQKQREELNEIVGDISPYWNMNLYDDNDDDDIIEYDYDDQNEYDSGEYYDETW